MGSKNNPSYQVNPLKKDVQYVKKAFEEEARDNIQLEFVLYWYEK